jgi:hypothetical protein
VDISAFSDRQPRRAQAFGELVANSLELTKVEKARVAGHIAYTLEPTHPIRGHERFGEGSFETGYLSAQRSPRCRLVDFRDA